MALSTYVDLEKLDPTLDEMQEFLEQARILGISGDQTIKVVGHSKGYSFAGTYQFNPKGLRLTGGGSPLDVQPPTDAELGNAERRIITAAASLETDAMNRERSATGSDDEVRLIKAKAEGLRQALQILRESRDSA